MFQQPAENTGEKVPMAELVGALCLIYVREVRQGVTTQFGEKEAVACNWHVLDGPKTGEVYEDALIFQGALIGSLKGAAGGDPVLGRIGLGVKKPGQNAPYVLSPFTAQDAVLATAYIQRLPQPFQAPAATSPAAAAAPPAAAPVPPAVTLDLSSLDPAVIELLKQAGQIPA